MASASTSKYNSHSLENESIKRVSRVFRFIPSLSLHFSFHIRQSFWIYWIINYIIRSHHVNTSIHVALFIIPPCSRKNRLPYMFYLSLVCKSFHATSFFRISVLWILHLRYRHSLSPERFPKDILENPLEYWHYFLIMMIK